MQVAIVDTKKKCFLAKNTRWYSLKRQQRKAPYPYVFTSKASAVDFIRVNQLHNPDENEIIMVKPEEIKTTPPRQVSVRRMTCGSRRKA